MKPEKIGPFRLKRAGNGEWYWTLVAVNGRVLATSETYKRRAGAFNGIDAARTVIAADKTFP